MLDSGRAGALATLQLRELADHVLPVSVLPGDQVLAVADDVLCRQPSVLRQRNEGHVHMRGFLIQVDNGGYEGIWALLLHQEVQCVLEVGADDLFAFALEEIRTAGDECFHQPDAVRAGAALGSGDLALSLGAVTVGRLDQVEVQVCAGRINVRIAGVGLFVAFVVALNTADFRALVFCESHNCILIVHNYLLVCRYR